MGTSDLIGTGVDVLEANLQIGCAPCDLPPPSTLQVICSSLKRPPRLLCSGAKSTLRGAGRQLRVGLHLLLQGPWARERADGRVGGFGLLLRHSAPAGRRDVRGDVPELQLHGPESVQGTYSPLWLHLLDPTDAPLFWKGVGIAGLDDITRRKSKGHYWAPCADGVGVAILPCDASVLPEVPRGPPKAFLLARHRPADAPLWDREPPSPATQTTTPLAGARGGARTGGS